MSSELEHKISLPYLGVGGERPVEPGATNTPSTDRPTDIPRPSATTEATNTATPFVTPEASKTSTPETPKNKERLSIPPETLIYTGSADVYAVPSRADNVFTQHGQNTTITIDPTDPNTGWIYGTKSTGERIPVAYRFGFDPYADLPVQTSPTEPQQEIAYYELRCDDMTPQLRFKIGTRDSREYTGPREPIVKIVAHGVGLDVIPEPLDPRNSKPLDGVVTASGLQPETVIGMAAATLTVDGVHSNMTRRGFLSRLAQATTLGSALTIAGRRYADQNHAQAADVSLTPVDVSKIPFLLSTRINFPDQAVAIPQEDGGTYQADFYLKSKGKGELLRVITHTTELESTHGLLICRGADGAIYTGYGREYTYSFFKIEGSVLPDGEIHAKFVVHKNGNEAQIHFVDKEGAQHVITFKDTNFDVDGALYLEAFSANPEVESALSAQVAFDPNPNRLAELSVEEPGAIDDVDQANRIEPIRPISKARVMLDHGAFGVSVGSSLRTPSDVFRSTIGSSGMYLDPYFGSRDGGNSDFLDAMTELEMPRGGITYNQPVSPYGHPEQDHILNAREVSLLRKVDISDKNIPTDATREKFANYFRRLQHGRKPTDTNTKLHIHGFLTKYGNISPLVSRFMGNVAVVAGELAATVPQDCEFDHVFALPNDTALSDAVIDNIAQTIATINKHPQVNISQITVSSVPPTGMTLEEHFELRKRLIVKLSQIGVSTGVHDAVQSGSLDIENEMKLANLGVGQIDIITAPPSVSDTDPERVFNLQNRQRRIRNGYRRLQEAFNNS